MEGRKPFMNANRLLTPLYLGLLLWLLLLAALVWLLPGATGRFLPIAALAIIVMVALTAGWLAYEHGRERQRRQETAELQALSEALLPALPDPAGLPLALAESIPRLLPGCDVTIWQASGDIIFNLPLEQDTPTDVLAAAYNTAAGDHYFWDNPESGEVGLVVAASDPEPLYLYLLPPAGRTVSSFIRPAQQVVRIVAAALAGTAAYEAALAEQTELYKEAIFTEAYRAELLSQRLAYERMQQELDLAWQIQTSFLPADSPDLEGWQISAVLEPARQMSGDFYDFIPLPDGRLGLVVADVADKGLGPALFMALCRTLIRTYAADVTVANGAGPAGEPHPDSVLAATNARILADTRTDLFVTVFYAVLDTKNGRLTYCNAGHNPPYVWRNNGHNPALEQLTRTALPLGIVENLESSARTLELEPGDVLVLYTDGITEAQDEEEGFFGEERLQRLVGRNCHRPAQIIGEKVVAAVYDFMGEAPQHDDMTLMVIVREEDGKVTR